MILRHFALGLSGSLLAASRAFAADLAATPAHTEGPFYPVAVPVDSDMDLVQIYGQAARHEHDGAPAGAGGGRGRQSADRGEGRDLAVRRAESLRSSAPA